MIWLKSILTTALLFALPVALLSQVPCSVCDYLKRQKYEAAEEEFKQCSHPATINGTANDMADKQFQDCAADHHNPNLEAVVGAIPVAVAGDD